MPEFSDLISQVSSNDIKTEDQSVKNETLQLLWDARGIIELAKWQGVDKEAQVRKEYESVRQWIIDATKEDLRITRKELDWLKAEVNKTNDNLANFYVKNVDMLNLETNKDIVLKTLKLLVNQKNSKENIKTLTNNTQLTVGLLNINKSLLSDINVIKATRPEWMTLFPEDILNIPNEFFQKDENLSKALEITSTEHKSALIMKASKVLTEDKLISLIWKINWENNPKTKLQDKDIPINLLKKDDKNVLWLNEDWKEMHIKKINEISENSINEILKTDIDARDLAYEVEYYLQKYPIDKLADNILIEILTKLNNDEAIIYAPKLLLSLDKKINVITEFSSRVDPIFIRFLPSEVAKNNDVQKKYIEIIYWYAKNIKGESDISYLLDYLEIDDLEIAKYFYTTMKNLWEYKSSIVFSDYKLREKIRRIIWNNKDSQDTTMKEMIKIFSSIDQWGKNLIDAVKTNNKAFIEINENSKEKNNFTNHLKEKFNINENIDDLLSGIINLKDDDLWKVESKDLYNKILKLCKTPEKAEEFIKEVKDYEIKKSVEKTDGIIKELNDKKFDKFAVKLEDIQNNFEDFLWNKIAEFKEKNKDKPLNIDAISKQAIEEYLKTNKKEWITPEEEAKIREILNTFVARRRIKSERDNIEEYRKTMSWEMKKEDFDKVMQNSLEQKYDFNEEKAIVEKVSKIEQNLFIPTDENYVKNGNTYTLEWANWEKIEWITEQEKNMTLGNPEATQNLINFHDFFKKLNLEWVWKYRWELMTAIWDIHIDPNDADSIKTEELRKFWNKILTFLANAWKDSKEWEKQTINLSSIESVNVELQKISWTNSVLNDNKSYNWYWEDIFTAFLREKWIIWWMYFKINWFKSYL